MLSGGIRLTITNNILRNITMNYKTGLEGKYEN